MLYFAEQGRPAACGEDKDGVEEAAEAVYGDGDEGRDGGHVADALVFRFLGEGDPADHADRHDGDAVNYWVGEHDYGFSSASCFVGDVEYSSRSLRLFERDFAPSVGIEDDITSQPEKEKGVRDQGKEKGHPEPKILPPDLPPQVRLGNPAPIGSWGNKSSVFWSGDGVSDNDNDAHRNPSQGQDC